MKKLISIIISSLLISLNISDSANAGSYTLEPTNELSNGLDYPSGLAVAPNGDIWWSDWSLDKVFRFDKDATGNTAPEQFISLRRSAADNVDSDVSAIAVDSAGFLYALNANAPTPGYVHIFNPALGSTQYVTDAVRTISFVGSARSIAVDSAGYIYVAHGSTGSNGKLKISIFEPGLTNAASATPFHTFTDLAVNVADSTYGLAVNSLGEVIVGHEGTDSIRIYAENSNGTPDRIITGDQTLLADAACTSGNIHVDSLDRIYVGSIWCNSWQILVFAASASENIAPIDIFSSNGLAELAPFALTKESTIWLGGDSRRLIRVDNPLTFPTQPSPSAAIDPVVAAKIAEEARARAVEGAKTEIKSLLSSGKPLTAEQLLKADFNGVTTKNIDLVNSDIAKLSDLDKTDLKQIEKVVLKFATVDKLAEGKTIYSSDLIAVGLIPQDSKIKSSITSALKKLPSSSLDSYEKIQAEIAAVEKIHADRKARLAAILYK